MGQKVKGGQWCPTCERPVMAVKNTHKVRNMLAVGNVVGTGGFSLLLAKSERYICPTCGGPTMSNPPTRADLAIEKVGAAIDERLQRIAAPSRAEVVIEKGLRRIGMPMALLPALRKAEAMNTGPATASPQTPPEVP